MEEYTYELKIPKERVAVLIGKAGKIKKKLEEDTESRIEIDSHEGDVFVTGKDALKIFTCREIIHAVGRGFNPDIGMQLLKQDYVLEILSIADYARNKNDEGRLKGRVIGAEGKSRSIVEELTETNICVYGKTVSIIGEAYNVSVAKRALESLLNGSMHAKVYKWLEQQRRKGKTQEMEDATKS